MTQLWKPSCAAVERFGNMSLSIPMNPSQYNILCRIQISDPEQLDCACFCYLKTWKKQMSAVWHERGPGAPIPPEQLNCKIQALFKTPATGLTEQTKYMEPNFARSSSSCWEQIHGVGLGEICFHKHMLPISWIRSQCLALEYHIRF